MASRHRVRADSNLLHKSVKIAYITHTILLQTSSMLKCSPSPFTALHCLAKTSLYNLQMSKSSAPPPTLSVLTGISFSRNSEPFSKIKSKKETLTGRESLDWVEILEDFPTRKRQRERERRESEEKEAGKGHHHGPGNQAYLLPGFRRTIVSVVPIFRPMVVVQFCTCFIFWRS